MYTNLSTSYSSYQNYGRNAPSGLQINYLLNKEVPKDTPMKLEILDAGGAVVYAENSNAPKGNCDRFFRKQLKRNVGAHRYQWNMKIGTFDCLKEFSTTNRDLTAYNAPPGAYKVRLTIGNFTQTQDFKIEINPRLQKSISNVAQAYTERDKILT